MRGPPCRIVAMWSEMTGPRLVADNDIAFDPRGFELEHSLEHRIKAPRNSHGDRFTERAILDEMVLALLVPMVDYQGGSALDILHESGILSPSTLIVRNQRVAEFGLE